MRFGNVICNIHLITLKLFPTFINSVTTCYELWIKDVTSSWLQKYFLPLKNGIFLYSILDLKPNKATYASSWNSVHLYKGLSLCSWVSFWKKYIYVTYSTLTKVELIQFPWAGWQRCSFAWPGRLSWEQGYTQKQLHYNGS